MKLFQYAVVYHEKLSKNSVDAGVEARHEIVIAPTSILGVDEASCRLIIARFIPSDWAGKLNHLEILIRPFDAPVASALATTTTGINWQSMFTQNQQAFQQQLDQQLGMYQHIAPPSWWNSGLLSSKK